MTLPAVYGVCYSDAAKDQNKSINYGFKSLGSHGL